MTTTTQMKNLLFTLFVLAGFSAFSQVSKPAFVSNSDLPFNKFISGVRYAEISLNAPNQELVDKQVGISAFYYLAKQYLQEIGFEYVALTSAEKVELEMSVGSYCEYTSVVFGGDIDQKSISNMSISFISCQGDFYSFQSTKKFTFGKFSDVGKKLVEDWKTIIPSKSSYNGHNQIRLATNMSTWSEASIKSYLTVKKEQLKPIEGIYERVRLSLEDNAGGKYTVGIVKNPDEDGFLIIYLSGAINNQDWKSGELKGKLNKTATPGFYTVDWITRDKSPYEDVYCNIDETGIILYSSGVLPLSYKFIKTLPSKE